MDDRCGMHWYRCHALHLTHPTACHVLPGHRRMAACPRYERWPVAALARPTRGRQGKEECRAGGGGRDGVWLESACPCWPPSSFKLCALPSSTNPPKRALIPPSAWIAALLQTPSLSPPLLPQTFVAMQIVQRNSTQPADCEMQLVAKDGVYMPRIPRKVDTIVLPSGARGELLVRLLMRQGPLDAYASRLKNCCSRCAVGQRVYHLNRLAHGVALPCCCRTGALQQGGHIHCDCRARPASLWCQLPPWIVSRSCSCLCCRSQSCGWLARLLWCLPSPPAARAHWSPLAYLPGPLMHTAPPPRWLSPPQRAAAARDVDPECHRQQGQGGRRPEGKGVHPAAPLLVSPLQAGVCSCRALWCSVRWPRARPLRCLLRTHHRSWQLDAAGTCLPI